MYEYSVNYQVFDQAQNNTVRKSGPGSNPVGVT